MQRPLLLLTCSARKRLDSGELPAIERYDGPMFRVLRRFRNQHPNLEFETFILSARFGWMGEQTPTPLYDQQPSDDPNWRLESQLALAHLIESKNWGPIFFDIGARYRLAVGSIAQNIPSSTEVRWAQGAPGMRTAQLGFWLENLAPHFARATPDIVPYNLSCAGHQAMFQGKTFRVEAAQLRALAKRWRDSPISPKARPFHWSVAIQLPHAVQYVPLKWLVSQIVGVPPGQFSTEQAKVFLCQIGMEGAIFSNLSKNNGEGCKI